MIRQGAVTRDGEGEAVVGIVMMLMGENSRVVVDRDLVGLELSPEGIHLDDSWHRSQLIVDEPVEDCPKFH